MAIKYVAPISNDGWLVVKDNKDNKEIALPQYLKVDTTRTKEGRTYFKVLEGCLRGKAYHVRTRDDNNNLTLVDASHNSYRNMTVTFYKSTEFKRGSFTLLKGDLSYESTKLPVLTLSDNPPPQGAHDLEIPDAPHPGGLKYSAHATTWFRIDHAGDRYLHTGRYSAGCITVDFEEDDTAWEKVYTYLIRCRKDTVSVGCVDVKIKE